METTFAIFKRNSLNAALMLAVLFMNGQIWLMNGRIEGLDDEIQSFRADMAEEFKAVRAEMAAGDQAIRADMAESNQAIRADMAESNRAIRADMAESNRAIRADVSALGERMARVETRLASVERVLYADFDAPPK